MTFFLEVVLVALPRAIETAGLNERDDRMQLAGVEERPVAATEVDDRARQSSEIHPVHHLSADQARPVVNGRSSDGIRRRGTPPIEYSGLRLLVRADSLEVRGGEPQAVTARALQQVVTPAPHERQPFPAAWTRVRGRLCVCSRGASAALWAERRACKHEREALRTTHRGQARAAVRAARSLRTNGRPAVWAVQRLNVGHAAHRIELSRRRCESGPHWSMPMGLMDFIKGELIDVIEWTDDSRDTLSYRFPDEDKAIKNGAQLIVRESQVVQFVYLGEFGDTFGPGKHTLTTENIPVLTKLKSWKYGFNSPFKADVYYVTARLFTGNKWGTANPIMMRDDDLGIVRARAFGTYDFKITDPKLFLKEVAGSDQNFRLDEFADTMRSRIVSIFADALASAKVPVFDVASRYSELGEALLPLINPVVAAKYGLQISSFIIENVSVPPEVEQAIDKRSSMAAVGNLNDYVKFQMAQGMEKGGSSGGMATELAVGLSIAQQIMQQQGMPAVAGATAPGRAAAAASPVSPDLLSPADVAHALGVPESDVMTIIDSGELAAKKIGMSYRIKRSALDEYLAR